MATASAHYIFDILRLVGTADRPLGASDVHRLLNLKLTTAHRGLNTLEAAGFVARHQASTKFVLGAMSRAVLQSFVVRHPLRGLALPYVQRASAISGHTASLFVPIGWYAVRIASVKGTSEVIRTGPVGECFPLSGVPAGRELLAAMTEERRGAFRRWAASHGEDGPADGGDGAAAAILDPQGEPLGAIAVEGIGGDAPETEREACRQVAGQLTQVIGGGHRRIPDPFRHLDPDTIRLPADR